MEKVIEIENLYKSFGEVKAVNDLSFSVKRGELFAFLGVNGAGKSTTISIMCGMLKRDGGNVKICGKNIDDSLTFVSKKLGVTFQNSVLDQALTVKENLKYRAALYGISGERFDKKLEELSELLDFKDILTRTVGKLSGGQRRRVDIARALVHDPDILILDEPTTGLDPQTRKLLWSATEKLRKEREMTVFLTTHYMEEAENADYVVILDAGKISAEGTPHDLKNAYTGDFITFYGLTEKEIESLPLPAKRYGDAVKMEVKDTAHATKLIVKTPSLFKDYEITKGKMDDVFLAATGKKLSGGEDND